MAKIVISNAPPARPRFNEDRQDPFELLQVENTGASKRGNTYWKTIRTCPREHALRNLVQLRRKGDAEALTVGIAFHLALEMYYRAIQAWQSATEPYNGDEYFFGGAQKAEKEAWACIEPLRTAEGYEESYAELERMLSGYFDSYRRKDRWRVIAVEENLEYDDGAMEYSARLDLIVEDYDRGGMWVIEHKSARTVTADLLAGYQLDQQILGQVWLLQNCIELAHYPALKGVIVNITTKHKSGARVERVECMPSRYHLTAFETSMRAWCALAPCFEELGWPQALGNCAGPSRYWSKCDFYDVCYGTPHLSVEQLVNAPPPMGFIRNCEICGNSGYLAPVDALEGPQPCGACRG